MKGYSESKVRCRYAYGTQTKWTVPIITQMLLEIHYITLQYYESAHKSNKKCDLLR